MNKFITYSIVVLCSVVTTVGVNSFLDNKVYTGDIYKSINIRANNFQADDLMDRWLPILYVGDDEDYYFDKTTICHKKYHKSSIIGAITGDSEEKDVFSFNIKIERPGGVVEKSKWEYDLINDVLTIKCATKYDKNGKVISGGDYESSSILRPESRGENVVLWVWEYYKRNGIKYRALKLEKKGY